MSGHRHTPPGMPWQQQASRRANLAENPYAGQGPVLLDIGDGVGAVVVRMPASMEGLEIEIVHRDYDRRATALGHVAVVARPTATAAQHAVVFPDLAAGSYELREPSGAVGLTVEVTGGAVTEASWPDRCG